MGKIVGSTFICKSMKLAAFLMEKGIVIKGLAPNKDGSGRNVFLFQNVPGIEELIGQYKEVKNNN